MLKKGAVKNTETDEIILCVEAEEGVPMGSEAGMPRYYSLDFEGWVLLSLITITTLALLGFIITLVVAAIKHFL